MFGSQVIDVAIGLFLLYFVLSLVSSSVVELVFSVTRLRFRLLRSRLREMLGDEGARELLAHGIMVAFGKRPSYLPANAFAVALFDNLCSAAGAVPRTFNVLRDRLVRLRTTAEQSGTLPAQPVRALLALVDEADQDMKSAQRRVEEWFDQSMERCTGAFKRRSQLALLVVGLAVAAGINADSVAVVGRLWTNAPLREALRLSATELVKPETDADSARPELFEAVKAVRRAVDAAGVSLPLGWQDETLRPAATFGGFAAKLAGWILTALAVSLGAPFWYDLIGRLVSLRWAGKTPESDKAGANRPSSQRER